MFAIVSALWRYSFSWLRPKHELALEILALRHQISVLNAFPYDTAPKYLLRDRNSIFGSAFVHRVEGMGIKQKLISPRSPWQSPYVERLIESTRRECLDRVMVLHERQLRQILEQFFAYYHEVRPHRSLAQDSPIARPIQSPDCGPVIEMPLVGGLHHHYRRQAAWGRANS
jgi:putative transposase